jgi:hypothetical protein
MITPTPLRRKINTIGARIDLSTRKLLTTMKVLTTTTKSKSQSY